LVLLVSALIIGAVLWQVQQKTVPPVQQPDL
jgi:hypothetical protein